MFRKSTLIALATAASFGFVMASVGAASAKPNGPNGKIAAPKVTPKPHFPKGPGKIATPKPNKPHWHPHRPHHPHVVVWRHRHPIVVGTRPVVVTAVPAVVPAGRCTCLTKEYTPEGAVVFKDTCTNEMAMNPPAVAPAPTAEVQPEK